MFKILIAEDDIELRQLFYRVLTLHGYSAICVSDGKEALDVLDKEYVDLIISDIMMPNMNGYELASSLRESGITIPILMITAKILLLICRWALLRERMITWLNP